MKHLTMNKPKMNYIEKKVTVGIIAINIVVFLLLKLIPCVSDTVLLTPQVREVFLQPWTLIIGFFSHEKLIHIACNMGLLYVFGGKLEGVVDRKGLLVLYLLSGLFGSLVTLPLASLLGWEQTVFGASAAVFGVVSAFAVIRPDDMIIGYKAKLWLSALFLWNVISALINPLTSIGAGAHVTGIVTGIVFGIALKQKEGFDSTL